MVYFNDIAKISNGKILQQDNNAVVTYIITDSRKIIINAGTVFFAIQGERHNGHDYVKELYQKGLRSFVIESEMDLSDFPDAGFIRVKKSIRALQQLAAFHRSQFTLPVLAITGSNGKTIVKEWLSQLLAPKMKVVKSPNSYNSQIGVPLSVWQINAFHQTAIFEAGISQPQEMEYLEAVIKPNEGIFTNIGSSHDEGFKSQSHKIDEKLKLFKNCKIVFYCGDHEAIHNALQKLSGPTKLFSWAENQAANIHITSIQKNHQSSRIYFNYLDQALSFSLPFADNASIANCMHCISYLLYHKFSAEDIQKGISGLSNVQNRLEIKQGINNCYIIDDSYNNDLAGLQIALDVLTHQKHQKKKTVILSDMLQTGKEGKILYKEISMLLQSKGIHRLIGIGPAISSYRKLFPMETEFYPSTEDFLSRVSNSRFNRELFLIKGARRFKFERIVHLLQEKVHGTVLEINLDAITHNLNYYRSKLQPDTKIMVMVKAFAYGSGSYEVANLLQFHRVDYLAVAYTDEGVALREHGIHLPVLVMNPSQNSFETIVKYKLEPEIYSISILRSLIAHASENREAVKIHLKLDTGMHRLGFEKKDHEALIQLLKENSHLQVVSIFSHMAGADEEIHNEFSLSQAAQFTTHATFIAQALNIHPLQHILNSAGIIRFPSLHLDMVRLGIGLYGVEASNLAPGALQPISVLKTTISQIKELKKGETIGYSRKGVVERDTKIATIAIGYADGYDRRFSNGAGSVLVNGKKAPVIGNVCMDMTMIDITGIEVNEEDEVIIFGKSKDGTEISINELAFGIQTIPYEILTKVSDRVKRVFYTE